MARGTGPTQGTDLHMYVCVCACVCEGGGCMLSCVCQCYINSVHMPTMYVPNHSTFNEVEQAILEW